jgi:sarcosine oxidase subunit gamma
MADRLSSLAGLHAPVLDGTAVALTELRAGSILQVSAWPDTSGVVASVVAEFVGTAVPAVGSAAEKDGIAVLAIAPGRLLIRSDSDDQAPRFEAAFFARDGAVVDLSHGRVVLRLEGEGADEVLSACVALDFDPTIFPSGRVAQSMIHHLDVVVHRRAAQSFDLWVLRSFALSLAEWVLDARLEPAITFRR